MSKVKVSLTSGNVVEKPLVTCFQGANGNYIVLDNETNGSMGLPIICISKINGSNVEKIFDQNEWGAVKENLKTIIAGTALPYLSLPEQLNAQDDFFTQLTLPVASFDALKNAYMPPASAPSTPEPVMPTAPSPVPEVSTAPQIAVEEPIALNTPPVVIAQPIIPEPVAPVMATTPLEPMPNIGIVSPTIETGSIAAVAPMPVPEIVPTLSPVMPEPQIVPTPQIEGNTEIGAQTTLPSSNSEVDAIKETFMKSCENMFDALLKKFQNK